MGTFDRIREKNSSYPLTAKCVAGYESCGLPARGITDTMVNKQSIVDRIPVGKYHPTKKIKISGVHRKSVSSRQECFGTVYWYDEFGRVSQAVTGGYIPTKAHRVSVDGTYLPDLPNDDPLRTQRLLKKAYAKLNEDSLGLGESFSELGKTLKMVKNPLEGMRKIFSRVFHKRGGGRRTADDAASAWLEYRYGWIPLYLTAVEILKNGIPDFEDGNVLSFAGVETDLVATDYKPYPTFYHPGQSNAMGVLSSATKIVKTTYQARIYLRVTDSSNFNAMKRGGSIYNVPAFLWEKTKLSFAVDWWFDVGNCIKSLCPTPGVNIHPNFTVSAKRWEVTENWFTATGFLRSPGVWRNTIPLRSTKRIPKSVWERSVYRRIVYPLAYQPEINLPKLDKSYNSFKHLVDSIGLIIQQVPRGAKRM